MTDKPTVYPKSFVLEADGNKYPVKMSFGLLTELCSGFATAEDVALAYTDQKVMNELMNQVLALRDDEGAPLTDAKQPNIAKMDPDLDHLEEFMTWVYGHVLSFFARRTRAFGKASASAELQLQELAKALSKRVLG